MTENRPRGPQLKLHDPLYGRRERRADRWYQNLLVLFDKIAPLNTLKKQMFSESLSAWRNFPNRHLIGIGLDQCRRALPGCEESFDRLCDLA